MALVICEWKKLIRSKLVVGLFILLTLTNLLTMYYMEREKEEYYYIYLNATEYEKYLRGEEISVRPYYYEEEKEDAAKYVQEYETFISGMENRAEIMKQSMLYQDEDSFLYRDLEKSLKDYEPLYDLRVSVGNYYGVSAYLTYSYGIFFLLAFLMVLVYCLLIAERDSGKLLLAKYNKLGHSEYALAKYGAILSGGLLFTLLQEAVSIGCYSYLYGWKGLSAPIQSIAAFRNCPVRITITEAVILVILAHIGCMVLFASLIYAAGTWFKNTYYILIAILGGLLAEFLFYKLVQTKSGINGLKVVNLFYLWNGESLLGQYVNLDVLSRPVSSYVVILIISLLVVFLAVISGTLLFDRTLQVRRQSVFDVIYEKLSIRRRCHSSILYFEFKKTLIQEKKVLVIVFAILLTGCMHQDIQAPRYGSTLGEAVYHYHMGYMAGRVNMETLSHVVDAVKEQESLERRLEGVTDEDERMILSAVYTQNQEGLELLMPQVKALWAKEKGRGKYFVDELYYKEELLDTRKSCVGVLVTVLLMTVLISGIFTMDSNKNMKVLINTTLYGGRRLLLLRLFTGVVLTGVILLLYNLVEVERYYVIDQFSTGKQLLSDFYYINSSWKGNLSELLAVGLIFKNGLLLLIMGGNYVLQHYIKNEFLLVAITAMVGGLLCILCIYQGISMETLLLF